MTFSIPGYVLSGSGLREEGVERVIAGPDGLVGRHLAVGLNAMLQAGKEDWLV